MEIEENQVKQWLKLIKRFTDKFEWLADSFVLDFYAKNHWSTLPKSWSDFLPRLTPEQLADLIDPNTTRLPTPKGTIPPLSLMCFKASVSLLSLNRRYDERAFENWVNSISTKSRDSGLKEFKNLFRRHVKLKKRHEVEQIGKIVSSLSCKTNATQVYDIGSGLGHLSRFLTYEYGLTLTCVDREQKFGENASKFDTELKSFVSKKQSANSRLPTPPSHKSIDLQFNTQTELFNNPSQKFGLTGLHSCGNLSPLILHNFVNSSADFVVSLGCCYMKMDQNGFPLSDFGKHVGLRYSYEAFEVSCHAIETYCQRLRAGQVKKLITHSYRATLETILTRHGVKHAGLRSVPHTEDLTFQEYALRATAHLPLDLSESDVTSEEITTKLQDWFKVVLFYSLRLMIATVIESAVLLDRSLYIHSTTKSPTFITACFNPSTSPRNLGIISVRKH